MTINATDKYALLDCLAEEFAERYRRGERPALKEYTDRYPDLADDIRDLFPAMVQVEQAEQDLHAPVRETLAVPVLRRLGDYRILREIGRGGMGVVYEAEQQSLARRVALKVLPTNALLDDNRRERFWREARAAAKLHHTNIVPVFDVGQNADACFYAMQFIPGEGLDQVIDELRRLREEYRTGEAASGERLHVAARSLLTGHFAVNEGQEPLATGRAGVAVSDTAATEGYSGPEPDASIAPRADSATETGVLPGQTERSSVEADRRHYFRSVGRIGQQVAAALAYAHARGVVHRDIKPSNLLLDAAGVVWVTDFGLAKTEDDGLTSPGDILGTLRYMAPERFHGECDARADVYSLGLTLYELLVLRPAFNVEDRAQLLREVQQREPSRPRSLDPLIPRDLETIVLKAIDKDPQRRYSSAEEMAEDLRRFLTDEPIRARRSSEVRRLALWYRRNPTLAILSGSLLLVLLLVAIGSTVTAFSFRATLFESEKNRELAEKAQLEGKYKLWESDLARTRAGRMSRQPGQRFESFRALRDALNLPIPPGRSRDELRNEAIACVCLPDIEVVKEWDALPTGSSGFAIDDGFDRYAFGDKDGTVSVRRLDDGKELDRLPGVGMISPYGGLRFSPDGRFLHQRCLVETGERSRLWRIDGPKPVLVLDDNHRDIAFRPDSLQFAVDYPDSSVRLFDTASAKELRRFTVPLVGSDVGLVWNPKLPRLLVSTTRSRLLLDVDTGKSWPIAPAIPTGFNFSDWHPDGRVLALSDTEFKIHLWDTITNRPVRPPLEGHRNSGIMMRFNHAGDRLLSTDWNNIWRLWDVGTGQQLLALPAVGAYLKFSPDDHLLAASSSLSRLRMFRVCLGQEFRSVVRQGGSARGGYGNIGQPALDGEGHLLAVSARDGVALIDLESGEEAGLLPIPGNAPVAFEADGALLTSGSTGLLRWPITLGPESAQRCFGPPERLFNQKPNHNAGISADGRVVAIPTATNPAVLLFEEHRILRLGPQNDVRSCAVSPDGHWVATGSHDVKEGGGARVWEARTGMQVKELPVGALCLVRFSPDGKWLLTGGGGSRLWHVGTWEEQVLQSEAPMLGGIGAFTRDGSILAIGDKPGVVRLLKTATGTEIARLTAPEQTRFNPYCFTPDGSRLIAVGVETQALHVFDLRAIRAGLVELGLDWDAPPLSPAPAVSHDPVRIQVTMGNFWQRCAAEECFSRATQHIRMKEYPQALTALRQAVQTDPTYARASNSLAWLLLTGPKDLRDPSQALTLARKAVEQAPGEFSYQNTLGVALFRTGHIAEAVAFLEKSLREGKGVADGMDLFVLAMCHSRQSDAVQALDCYDRGVRWLEEQRDRIPALWVAEISEFQAEAEAMLKPINK
jgi:serine/threonine protein kinase/WD40 repeat protein/Tfp pilus assembly protein PilF